MVGWSEAADAGWWVVGKVVGWWEAGADVDL